MVFPKKGHQALNFFGLLPPIWTAADAVGQAGEGYLTDFCAFTVPFSRSRCPAPPHPTIAVGGAPG
jgi:hypothetical protein